MSEKTAFQVYNEVILNHSKNPLNFGDPSQCRIQATKNNPLCGDRVILGMDAENGRIEKLVFKANACALCLASCSLMTDLFQHAEISPILEPVHEFLTVMDRKNKTDSLPGFFGGDIQKLILVKKHPSRIHCVTLGWQAFSELLAG